MVKNSRYKRIPLNVAGGSNETRSRALSISKLVNWYPEAVPDGVTEAALMPWPGLSVAASLEGYTYTTDGSLLVYQKAQKYLDKVKGLGGLSHYELGDGQTGVLIDSISSNNGTHSSVTNYADGLLLEDGTGADYDGSTSRSSVTSQPFAFSDSSFTVNAWVKLDNNTGYDPVFSTGGASFEDPSYNLTTLIITGDGADGSTTTFDRSPTYKPVSLLNGTTIDDTQSKYYGTAMKLPPFVVSTPLFSATGDIRPSGDFTFETWLWRDGTGVKRKLLSFGNEAANQFYFDVGSDGILRHQIYGDSGTYRYGTREILNNDPYYDKVVFLITGNGTDGSDVFLDNSKNEYPLVSGTGPNAYTSVVETGMVLSNNRSKYYSTAMTMRVGMHDVGAYVTKNPNYYMPTLTDYTEEFWFYISPFDLYPSGGNPFNRNNLSPDIGGRIVSIQEVSGAPGYRVIGRPSGEVTLISSAYTRAQIEGSWHHAAASLSGGIARFFLDGTLVHSTSSNGYSNNVGNLFTPQIYVDHGVDSKAQNYVNDYRLTVGVGRYTANFVPPGPFSSGVLQSNPPAVPLGWSHIAFSRSGHLVKAFIDGVHAGTRGCVNGTIGNSAGAYIYNENSTAYINDLRLTNGVARYSANFTPPGALATIGGYGCILQNGIPAFRLNTTTVSGVSAIGTGTSMVSFVCNREDDTAKVFANAAQVGTVSIAALGAMSTPLTPRIGEEPGFGLFGGIIDELSVFDRALTQSELQTLYLAGTTSPGDDALLSSPNTFADRGCHVFNGITYFVKGANLYRLNRDLTTDLVGAINGTDYCSFADNGGVMVICNGLTPYSYNGTTLTSLTSITFNPSVVTYITTRFVFDSSNDFFYVSDSFSTNVRTVNSATSESAPDSFTAPFAFGQMLYLFGENTIEPWQPAVAQPPFARATQAIIENVGCSAPHGIANTIDFVYFIHKGGIPYRMRGFQVEPIAASGMINKFNSYNCTKYRARSLSFDGQNFVIFDFYDNNATWCFSETTNTWLQLGSGSDPERFWGGSYCFNYGLHTFVDIAKPLVHHLAFDSAKNQWGAVVREKVFEFLSGEKAGRVRGKLELSRVILGVESGCGLVSGQGEEPLIGVQVSTDGKTWNQEQFVELGRMGEFSKQVEVSMRVKFQQLALRVRLYDPVGFAFFSAAIDVREAGH